MQRQGADDEFARLAPRIQKLKEAVAEREQTIASMTKELRALRVQVARSEASAATAAKQKPVADDGTLARLETSARADAELIAELRANAVADALEIKTLREAAAHDAQQLQDWMRWACSWTMAACSIPPCCRRLHLSTSTWAPSLKI